MQCASASACTLRVVIMVAVTRPLWLDSARMLRIVAVVLIARLARCARSRRCSWRLATIIIYAPLRRTPNIIYLHGCRTKHRWFINYV